MLYVLRFKHINDLIKNLSTLLWVVQQSGPIAIAIDAKQHFSSSTLISDDIFSKQKSIKLL